MLRVLAKHRTTESLYMCAGLTLCLQVTEYWRRIGELEDSLSTANIHNASKDESLSKLAQAKQGLQVCALHRCDPLSGDQSHVKLAQAQQGCGYVHSMDVIHFWMDGKSTSLRG